MICICSRLALTLQLSNINKMKTADIINILRDFKQRRGKDYGIISLGLFGSAACGEQHADSDIDICVELEKPSFFTRMNLRYELEELFHCKVDVISLRAIMRPLFRKSLNQDAIFI